MAKADLAPEWGARIRDLRRRRNLTVFQLAQISDVEQGNLSRIENGRQVPGDEVRIRIAAALGVRVEEIWSYPDTRAQDSKAVS